MRRNILIDPISFTYTRVWRWSQSSQTQNLSTYGCWKVPITRRGKTRLTHRTSRRLQSLTFWICSADLSSWIKRKSGQTRVNDEGKCHTKKHTLNGEGNIMISTSIFVILDKFLCCKKHCSCVHHTARPLALSRDLRRFSLLHHSFSVFINWENPHK